MANLSPDELAEMRRDSSAEVTVNYTKPQVNAALQAIETWYEKAANQNSLKNDIDAATLVAGITFPAATTKKFIKHWMTYKKKVS